MTYAARGCARSALRERQIHRRMKASARPWKKKTGQRRICHDGKRQRSRARRGIARRTRLKPPTVAAILYVDQLPHARGCCHLLPKSAWTVAVIVDHPEVVRVWRLTALRSIPLRARGRHHLLSKKLRGASGSDTSFSLELVRVRSSGTPVLDSTLTVTSTVRALVHAYDHSRASDRGNKRQ